jgi:hypothetical protein
MPKRSNDFQKLIYLIHHQLANQAIVTESKFLHDRAVNKDREVDIVIETEIGGHPIIIGIECQGRGRVADVEWVEQMKSKHESLPIDKLILVSQSGFTETARTKAQAFGIKTMTMGQAARADWNLMVSKIPTVQVEKWGIEPSACFALIEQRDAQINTLQLDMDQSLYTKAENELIEVTVREAIEIIIDTHAEQIIEQLKETNIKEHTYAVFQMEFNAPQGTYLIDASNIRREINSLCIIGHGTCESELVDMQDGSFGSAQIAFGKTKTVDTQSLITIVEQEEGPNTAALMFPSNDKETINIVDLREVKKR